MALEAVLIAACAHRLQGAELRMGLFVGIFYEIGVSFWSFLLPAWLGVLFHSQDFLGAGTLAGQSALWLLHGLLAVLAAWLSRGREINRKSAFRARLRADAGGIPRSHHAVGSDRSGDSR